MLQVLLTTTSGDVSGTVAGAYVTGTTTSAFVSTGTFVLTCTNTCTAADGNGYKSSYYTRAVYI